ncbi:hypothetical protein BYT27DRAFT_7313041 [Phlegmacium glaucopus]|nr:hypothetical protein BYT27DRAFT_7313041 [Phlegmacium glaucopus]
MANQKKASFSVTKFIHDTVSLESVWDNVDKEQQTRIVKELFDAVTKLHASAIVVGGPAVGYFTDIQGFLQGLIKSHCTFLLDPETGDVTIHSKFDDINPVQISSSDLQLLQHNIVLCHQDLEPRNILVHPNKLEDGTTHYRVAAILDWEMSGFFPFSYEYVCKDLFLGSANIFPTWYALFKQHGGPLVPMSPLPTYQARFMEAIELIHYSWERGVKPMSSLITKRWLAREGAVRQQPAGTGWLKDGNSLQSKRVPEAEMDELVNQILKELGRI